MFGVLVSEYCARLINHAGFGCVWCVLIYRNMYTERNHGITYLVVGNESEKIEIIRNQSYVRCVSFIERHTLVAAHCFASFSYGIRIRQFISPTISVCNTVYLCVSLS